MDMVYLVVVDNFGWTGIPLARKSDDGRYDGIGQKGEREQSGGI